MPANLYDEFRKRPRVITSKAANGPHPGDEVVVPLVAILATVLRRLQCPLAVTPRSLGLSDLHGEEVGQGVAFLLFVASCLPEAVIRELMLRFVAGITRNGRAVSLDVAWGRSSREGSARRISASRAIQFLPQCDSRAYPTGRTLLGRRES